MNWNPYGSCLVRYSPCYGLSYPPGCISTEFESLSVVKLFNSLQQTQVSFLNQIQKLHASSHIAFCDTDNKSQVGLIKTSFCLFVSHFNSVGKLHFLFCSQKRHLANFPQIHSDMVLKANTFHTGFQVLSQVFFLGFILYYVNAHLFRSLIHPFNNLRLDFNILKCGINLVNGENALSFTLLQDGLDDFIIEDNGLGMSSFIILV